MTDIFVFGSNEAGRHGKGAAKYALDNHGAIYGQGVGLQGQSYAIPTKDKRLRVLTIEDIGYYVSHFLDFARAHREHTFNITKIGCGLAGYPEEIIKPMFRYAPRNCKLPSGWVQKDIRYRILVAGSRSIKFEDKVFELLDKENLPKHDSVLISGGAKGIDTIGERWAEREGIEIDVFKAPWDILDVPHSIIKTNKFNMEYNVRAGYIRNVWMGVCCSIAIVLIRNNSKGSRHMIKYLNRLKKKVKVIEL